ncbi:ribonuclease H-like domain-containing protein [Collybia nuda]|uniref:Ribonuclease H-like domain-containing protein n=1 Tax=Collybia nuda TaxID=64659 RepID=A0A9P5YFB4_9AGAR|nr:ribonuclease H-like domain-containing protein [Collybia nuda]
MSTRGITWPDYQLCDKKSTLKRAVASLISAPAIIIDCEGDTLGKQGGSLSVISLCSAITTNIFLIDVIKLRSSLSPLFNLLQSTKVVKIMFDGRMDFSALYHEFGVHLRNVIDLQLVDIHSRQSRGETDVTRISRLSPFLNPRHIALMPDFYAGAIKLNGLSQCIEEHLGLSGFKKSTVNHDNWLDRPLSNDYLSYAAADIRLMGLLYDEFSVKGYTNYPGLCGESVRYVELWKNDQPVPGDLYKSHPLLPLEILYSYPNSIRRGCSGCKRFLSQASFRGNGIRCLVCKVVKKKGLHKNQKKKLTR